MKEKLNSIAVQAQKYIENVPVWKGKSYRCGPSYETVRLECLVKFHASNFMDPFSGGSFFKTFLLVNSF